MVKVLISYFSLSGNTEKMAEYVAEGMASTAGKYSGLHPAITALIATFSTSNIFIFPSWSPCGTISSGE